MSETNDWKQYREEQQARRSERLPIRTQEILSLRDRGYQVSKLSDYQFRIDDRVDVYPIHRRFHILGGRRGTYAVGRLADFINDLLRHDVTC